MSIKYKAYEVDDICQILKTRATNERTKMEEMKTGISSILDENSNNVGQVFRESRVHAQNYVLPIIDLHIQSNDELEASANRIRQKYIDLCDSEDRDLEKLEATRNQISTQIASIIEVIELFNRKHPDLGDVREHIRTLESQKEITQDILQKKIDNLVDFDDFCKQEMSIVSQNYAELRSKIDFYTWFDGFTMPSFKRIRKAEKIAGKIKSALEKISERLSRNVDKWKGIFKGLGKWLSKGAKWLVKACSAFKVIGYVVTAVENLMSVRSWEELGDAILGTLYDIVIPMLVDAAITALLSAIPGVGPIAAFIVKQMLRKYAGDIVDNPKVKSAVVNGTKWIGSKILSVGKWLIGYN